MHSAGCLILFSGLCVLVVHPSAKVQEARIIQDPSDLLFAFIPLFSCLSSPSFRFSAYDVSCWIGLADRGLFSVMGMAAAQRWPLNCQDSLWHTFVFMLGQAFVSSDANWVRRYIPPYLNSIAMIELTTALNWLMADLVIVIFQYSSLQIAICIKAIERDSILISWLDKVLYLFKIFKPHASLMWHQNNRWCR